MTKSQLKQLIREVISELSPQTLFAASSKLASLGRGDKGEKMKQIAVSRFLDKLDWNKLAKLAGKKWDPEGTSTPVSIDKPQQLWLSPEAEKEHQIFKNKKEIRDALTLKLKFYDDNRRIMNKEHEYYIIDAVDERKDKKLIAMNKNNVRIELFVQDNMVKSRILPFPYITDLAFTHSSRSKLIDIFKNIGVNINPNNAHKY